MKTIHFLFAVVLIGHINVSDAVSQEGCRSFSSESGNFRSWPEPLQTTERAFLDALNNEKKLSDFSGRPLIIHFWGTWCPPCLKEMPALDRFQKKVSDEKLEILAINRDSGGTDSTIDFYVNNQIRNLALYTDRMGLFAHEMKVGKVPVTIYVNSDGLEIGRIFGLLDWDSDTMIQHVRSCLLQ